MQRFEDILKTALAEEDLLGLVLSKPCAACAVSEDKWTVRPVELRGRRHYQWAAQERAGDP